MPVGSGRLFRCGRALRRRLARSTRTRRAVEAPLAVGVLESTTALVCVVDLRGEVLMVNPALLTLTGYGQQEMVGRSLFETLVIPEDLVPARAALERAATADTSAPVEADWLDRHGGRHRIHIHSGVLREPDGAARAVAYIGTDVTEQRSQQAELRERAETDGLTGLRNRTALLSALQSALAPGAAGSADAVGLLFCDLDGFKRVNDRHGHLVGDALLVEVGRRLLRLTRPPQVVSRLGGDEFLILTPAATPASLAQLSRAIEHDMRRPFATRHGELTIGVSVGSALGQVGDDPAQLVEQADRHMYGIKTTSRAGDRRAP